MKIKDIQTIEYRYGEETAIKKFLYRCKAPVLIKIKDFPDAFNLDYFYKNISGRTTYSTFAAHDCIAHQIGDFKNVIAEIKQNKPYRIFGKIMSRAQSAEIEKYVPLWQCLPLRPRYFEPLLKVAYFFGGKGSHTGIHFDREHCCILHLCLSGKKQFLLFTQDQNDYIYKTPFIGDSLLDFSQPLPVLYEQFPKLRQATGYEVTLEKGDMLFMPRNCWHFTRYLDASAAASYVFYPKKFFQYYGFFTGHFFWGYEGETGFRLCEWHPFKKFTQKYAHAAGKTRVFYKILEKMLYVILLPIVSILSLLSYTIKPRRLY
ncbi:MULTISPECIES: cupin-like domain-containing protein [Legionella]|uniref:cupin-like domain-containing protein n=1 Tax=Legionella TaxID=445 RepID=UPI000F8D218A|nr:MULTISPECIES: cupin-like domain-containing protein [Legionella]MCP0914299.1 cupin-like domain-containing protein [Legionella sp. 27cVA30]RUR11797.1 cupin [Legionella septentrionalis]RUR17485.1 cupin [Legionella septentrionalis]